MACCLINGVVPPDLSMDDEKPIITFDIADDDQSLVIGHSNVRVHVVRRDHREWRHSEDTKGLVSPADFFDWCELEGIDTNYLRLLREIAGFSTGRQFGSLPLKGLQRYGFVSRS